jgi:hypothetical protein
LIVVIWDLIVITTNCRLLSVESGVLVPFRMRGGLMPIASMGGIGRVTIPAPDAPPGPPTPTLARHPDRAGDLFRLHKNRREARAALFTHQLGWGGRLLVGSQLEVVQTQVCHDQEELLAAGELWKKVRRVGDDVTSLTKPESGVEELHRVGL